MGRSINEGITETPARFISFVRTPNLLKLTLTLPVLFLTSSFALSAEFPFEDARPHYTGGRALGMGNAFTAVADDASAGFWNPAGLIQWSGVKLFGVNKFRDRTDYAFDPKGIGYSYRRFGLFWGNKIALGVESGTPDFNYYGFAYQISSHVAGGANLKFRREHPSDHYQFFGTDTSYDFALLVKPRTNLKFGLLAGHLPNTQGIHWITIGAAFQFRQVLFASDISVPRSGRPDLYFGIEWAATPFLYVRTGYSDHDWTGGIGLDWKWGRIDYARIYEDEFTSDFISAELRF